jgi:hypothetical protein
MKKQRPRLLIAEAAVIIWEWINRNSGEKGDYSQLHQLRSDWGTAELRHHAIVLAPYVLDVCALIDAEL